MDKQADHRRRSSSFGFPDGQPPTGPSNSTTFPFDSKEPPNKRLLAESLLFALGKLGTGLETTVLFQLKQKGIDLTSASTTEVDLIRVYMILKESVGPGADLIMEDAWEYVRKGAREEAEKR